MAIGFAIEDFAAVASFVKWFAQFLAMRWIVDQAPGFSDFEVFKKRLVPLKNSPYVTIQRKGTMSMNLTAFQMLGSPRAVELMYSRERKVVGMRGVDPDTEHAYPIRAMNGDRNGPFILSGTAFARYYDIDTSIARRYAPTMERGVLMVDLSVPGTDVTGPRGRRSADEVEATAPVSG